MSDVDMSKTVDPKSDQLNADDLIAGPRTIKISKVTASSTPEQPVSVYFEGDNGKPWKPCKSMRRVLIALWGSKGSGYIGKRLTLYRDESVKFGGIETGGIRISHADIDSDTTIAITESRAKRKPTTIRKLAPPSVAAPQQNPRVKQWKDWATMKKIDLVAVLRELDIASLENATDEHWGKLKDYANGLSKKPTTSREPGEEG